MLASSSNRKNENIKSESELNTAGWKVAKRYQQQQQQHSRFEMEFPFNLLFLPRPIKPLGLHMATTTTTTTIREKKSKLASENVVHPRLDGATFRFRECSFVRSFVRIRQDSHLAGSLTGRQDVVNFCVYPPSIKSGSRKEEED
jgi:hypothetical protein